MSGPLTFSLYGAQPEVAAWRAAVAEWSARNPKSLVTIDVQPSADAVLAKVQGTAPPDVFLLPRDHVAAADAAGLLRAELGDLMVEQGIDFGDEHQRDALKALSQDSKLLAMPCSISPMVIYYNRALVNFAQMERRGLDVPDEERTSWSFEQFAAAASYASRPASRGAKGVSVEHSLRGLAPFIYSGGGDVFDNLAEPTSLALSSGASRSALTTVLQTLRDARVTLSDEQLAQHEALWWFERGKLGMIPGFRSLTPRLRQVSGLDFDVISMPGEGNTIGEVFGLCMSSRANADLASSLIAHLVNDQSAATLARTGYSVPTNLAVAASAAFLQPNELPVHAEVFTSGIRDIVPTPETEGRLPELEAAVAPEVRQLFAVGVLDLDGVTAQIDEDSKAILAPTPTPSGGPS